MKQRIFIDMDGTLFKWNSSATIQTVATRGYFRDLPAETSVVNATKELMKNPNFDIFILTSVFIDDHSKQDKLDSLKRVFGSFPFEKVIFVPFGDSKKKVLEETLGICKDDVLIDDFSHNLREWHGIAIKIYNNVNGTNNTWTGYSIRSAMTSTCMLNQILGIIKTDKCSEREIA